MADELFSGLNDNQRTIMGLAALGDAFGSLGGKQGGQAMKYGALFGSLNKSKNEEELRKLQIQKVNAEIAKLGVETNQLRTDQALRKQLAQFIFGIATPETESLVLEGAEQPTITTEPLPPVDENNSALGLPPMPFLNEQGSTAYPAGANPVLPPDSAMFQPTGQQPAAAPAPAPQAPSPMAPTPQVPGLSIDQNRLLQGSTMAALTGQNELSSNLTSLYNAMKPELQFVEMPDGSKKLYDMKTGSEWKGGNKTQTQFGPALKPEQIVNESRSWDKDYYKPVLDVVGRYQNVVNLINTGEGGIVDYGVLISSIKALEPNSAVLQGEAESAGAMRSIAGRMEDLWKQASKGGVGSDEARYQLATLAAQAAQVAVETYNRQAKRKTGVYSQLNMDPNLINSMLTPIEMPKGAGNQDELRSVLGMPPKPAQLSADLRSKLPAGAQTAILNGRVIYAVPGSQNWVYLDNGEVAQ